ncbi:MAG TPA: hypothetical protein VEY09_00665 [Pyrinomonadaceae bacterium]|nr:hypothetical protein [Pyrinomonadaceae bacterium]
MQTPKTRALALFSLLLALGLAAACDQTEQANQLVTEMNAHIEKGQELSAQATARSEEIQSKNFEAEREEVRRLGRESADIYGQARDHFGQAADKAEQASKLKVQDWFREYLTLKAQQMRRTAEAFDLSAQEGQAAAGEGTLAEINQKIEEFEARIEKINQENQATLSRIKQLEEEHRTDLKEVQGAK